MYRKPEPGVPKIDFSEATIGSRKTVVNNNSKNWYQMY